MRSTYEVRRTLVAFALAVASVAAFGVTVPTAEIAESPTLAEAQGLDRAYTFTAVVTDEDWSSMSNWIEHTPPTALEADRMRDLCADWTCDFTVSFDRPIAADSVYLAGQYDYYGSAWVGFNLPALEANQEVRLLADGVSRLLDRDVSITYAELCVLVGQFRCGFATRSSDNAGTRITVALKMTNGQVTNTVSTTVAALPDCVCEIGTVGYSSVGNAFHWAESGDTVRMIANATNLTTVGVNRSVTLDLNGKTVTKRTETTEGHVGEAFRIFAGGALTVADLSDGQDGTIDSRRSVAYVSGGSLCVSNGTLNAYETAVHMDFGSVRVAGGEVRGRMNGIVLRGGTLRVEGGKVTSAGVEYGQGVFINDYDRYYDSDGCCYRRCRAYISGGEIGSYSNNALRVYFRSDSGTEIVTITGGRFRGGNAPAIYGQPIYEWQMAASAGLYSTQPHKAYIAYGYGAVANTDEATNALYPWTIGTVPPIARIVDGDVTNDYWRLERAVKAVKANQTIDILADNSEAFDVTHRFAFTMRSNGYALTGKVKPSTSVSDDWHFVVNDDGTCSYCANPNRAKVLTSYGTWEFPTFEEALAYANTLGYYYVDVRLMKGDTVTNALSVARSNVTIDLDGETLTFAEGAGLRIEGNNVYVVDGTLAGEDGADVIEVVGSDAMLDSVDSTMRVVASGSYGNVAVEDCAFAVDDALTARDGAVILTYAGTYDPATAGGNVIAIAPDSELAHVIVRGGDYGGTLRADSGFLDIRAGTYTNWTATAANDGEVLVTGGTYDRDPSAFVDGHYRVVTNSPSAGRYTVKCRYECRMVAPDASILCWTNLQDAVDMIRAGESAAIVLTLPESELTVPQGCRVWTDSDGTLNVTVYTYVFQVEQDDGQGNVSSVTKYCENFEDYVQYLEDNDMKGSAPSFTTPTPPSADEIPRGYKVIKNGDSYVLTHKIYTCQVVDASGKTLGKYETIAEAVEAMGTDGVKIVPTDNGDGDEDDEYEDPSSWFDESAWDWADPEWNNDPTDQAKQTRMTREGYTVVRILNSDSTYTYSLEIYVAQIGDGNLYTTFEAAIDAKTNAAPGSALATSPIVVRNYSSAMVAPADWKFVEQPRQTGDASVFHLVAKVYVCSIGGPDGKKYESFVEAIDALTGNEASGELLVLNYSETLMTAPSGWRFRNRGGYWTLSRYASTGAGDVDVSLEACGSKVGREDIARVVKDVFIAERIETMTQVLGVKLSLLDVTNAVGTVTSTSGVQQVVSAAKASGDGAFRTTLEASTNVTIRVDVAVSPIRYAPASSSQNTGVLGFSLAPTATVTACSASGTAVSKVRVTNDMIDTNQLIAVSFYTGFKPLQVVHRADDGTFVREYLGDEIGYETNGVTTVWINHFSSLTMLQEPTYAAKVVSGSVSTNYVMLVTAFEEVAGGETIVILSDNDESFTVPAKSGSSRFTIDNSGEYALTGTITPQPGFALSSYGTTSVYGPVVARIGEDGYSWLQSAIGAAHGGSVKTVTLSQSTTESAMLETDVTVFAPTGVTDGGIDAPDGYVVEKTRSAAGVTYRTVYVNGGIEVADCEDTDGGKRNVAIPREWLLDHDVTEAMAEDTEYLGFNGIPVWQSYVLGLDPWEEAPAGNLQLLLNHDGTVDVTFYGAHTDEIMTSIATVTFSFYAGDELDGAFDTKYEQENDAFFENMQGAAGRRFFKDASIRFSWK